MKELRCYDQCFQSLYNSFQQISARNSIKTGMVLPLDLYFSLSSLSVCLWIYRTMMGKVLFPKQRMFSSSKEELLKLCGSWGFFEITDLSLDFFFFGRFRETVGICLEFKRVSKMAQGGKSEIINQALQMFVGKEPFDYMQWIVHLNAGEMGTAWISRPWAAILGGKELVGDGKTGVCILSALLPIAIFMDLTLFIWQCTQYCFARENCTKQAQCISIFIVYWAEPPFTWSHPLFNLGFHVPFPVQPVSVVSIAGLPELLFLWFECFFVWLSVKTCRTFGSALFRG